MGRRMVAKLINTLPAHAPLRSDDFSRPYDRRNRSRIVSHGRKWSVKSHSTVALAVRVSCAVVTTAYLKNNRKITVDLHGARIIHRRECSPNTREWGKQALGYRNPVCIMLGCMGEDH